MRQNNDEILRISSNFMDFFYLRFQGSAYVNTPLALNNEAFSSNLPTPYQIFLAVTFGKTEKVRKSKKDSNTAKERK